MSEAISNIWRRPLRAALTIRSNVIGFVALTVARAVKLNVLVDGGDEYVRTRSPVFDAGAASGLPASSRPTNNGSSAGAWAKLGGLVERARGGR